MSALSNFAQKSLRFSTGRLHGPRGAMKTDCVKALLASCSIFQDVHWVSALLPHTKSSHVTIPMAPPTGKASTRDFVRRAPLDMDVPRRASNQLATTREQVAGEAMQRKAHYLGISAT